MGNPCLVVCRQAAEIHHVPKPPTVFWPRASPISPATSFRSVQHRLSLQCKSRQHNSLYGATENKPSTSKQQSKAVHHTKRVLCLCCRVGIFVFHDLLQKVWVSGGLPQKCHPASYGKGTTHPLLEQCQSPGPGAVPTGFPHRGVLWAVRNTQAVP